MVKAIRFTLLWVLVVQLFSCDETESTCADLDISFTDEALYAEHIAIDDETFRYDFYFSGQDEVDLCNFETLLSLTPGAFKIGIKEAVFRSCESCLEILEWYGPDCDPAYALSDDEHTIRHTKWYLSEIIQGNETHYPPCFNRFGGTLLENDTAEFFLGNKMWMAYEFQNELIVFDNTVHMTLVGVTQYESFLENLFFEHLFNKAPLTYELVNNQLTLIHENATQFIFYAE